MLRRIDQSLRSSDENQLQEQLREAQDRHFLLSLLREQENLARMEELKVLVDLSHANKRTVKEAIEVSTRPLTISHTGCNALYRHPRNNDDADFSDIVVTENLLASGLTYVPGSTSFDTDNVYVGSPQHIVFIQPRKARIDG